MILKWPVVVNSTDVFFHYFFSNSVLISATDGTARIFSYNLMLRSDHRDDMSLGEFGTHVSRVAPNWDL